MKSYHEQAIRKYLMICTVLGCAIILIWLILCHWHLGLLSVLFLLILLIINKITVSIIAKKTLFPVLFEKLDAVEFQKIVNDNRFSAPLIFRTSAAISSGDYQTVVNIATKSLSNKTKSIKVEYYYLSLLARAYFELRDFDKLNLLLKKYDKIKALYPSKKLFSTANSIWSYYRYFLDGNFEACKTICRERLLELNSKSWDAKIRKLNDDFAYAVACYDNGDTKEAIKCFESIISYAPNMNSSELSKKYVEAIQTDSKISLFSEIIPNDSVKGEEGKTHNKKWKILRNIGWALILVSATIYVFSVIINPGASKKQNAEYEKQLNNIVDEYYDDFRLLGYSNVEFDSEIIDVVVLVEYENKIDVLSYVAYEDGTKAVEKRIVDIKPDITYSFESTTETYQLYVSLMNNDDYSRELSKIEFEYNKKDMVFVVEQVASLD